MREIQAAAIEQAVYDLILEASYNIGPDVCEAVRRYCDAEPSPTGRAVLHQLLENYQIASAERVAAFRDTFIMLAVICMLAALAARQLRNSPSKAAQPQ